MTSNTTTDSHTLISIYYLSGLSLALHCLNCFVLSLQASNQNVCNRGCRLMLLIDLMAQRQSGSSLDDVQKSCLKSKCVKIENKNVIVFENV